ncbi:hypothetical protein [Aliiglaciecola litoralis]|uniref:SMODS and SLOG-associating 2TM effector domain-containing protein n=1 Tax=Aliiglaciecola litoralis TaxID=582857 RepID=A0ABP3WSG4_9ALTE
MASALAINIGVSGHRDIPLQDVAKLEAAIDDELNAMQQRYPNSTINVLSGLAEGADQLVARVALKRKVNVIAVLPFDIEEYENDFTEDNAKSEFSALLAQCVDVKVCHIDDSADRDEGYSALGRTLVSCSDIILALWDGVVDPSEGLDSASVLPGGTADVVKMCVEGLMDDSSLLFSKPNKTYCKWLLTNRTRHPSLPASIGSAENIASWKPLPIPGNQELSVLQDILGKTEHFNLDAQAISQQDKDNSVAFLLGSLEKKDTLGPITKLIEIYSVADCLAQTRQKQRFTSLKLITVLSFFAITAQQVYAGLFPTLTWFIIHIVLVAIVLGIYRLFFVGTDSKEEQFVEWRVFAEDLRVQIFWHIAGISDHCANNYRTTKLYEMDWIVDNLNKLMMTIPEPQQYDINFVRKNWIIDQRNYFYGQRGERGRAAQLMVKFKKFKILSVVFFALAIALMFFSVFKIQFNWLSALSDDLLFIIIALAFISSALLKTFSAQMGFEELSQRYLRTGYFFQQAMNRMAIIDAQALRNQTSQIRSYQNVIKTIGIEALNENAAWLQLHKMNAYQVQVS